MQGKKYSMEELKAVASAINNAPKFSPFNEKEVSRKNALDFLRPKVVVLYTKGYDAKMIYEFFKTLNSPVLPSQKEIKDILQKYDAHKQELAAKREQSKNKKQDTAGGEAGLKGQNV